jgi:hypothetical protein
MTWLHGRIMKPYDSYSLTLLLGVKQRIKGRGVSITFLLMLRHTFSRLRPNCREEAPSSRRRNRR